MNNALLHLLTELQHHRALPDAGICGNVTYALKDMCMPYEERQKALQKMHVIMRKWPDDAGYDIRYPVEGAAHEYVISVQNGTLWKNERRHALLRWMIKELENESRLRTDLPAN